jgi:exodeoxyribonuclease VII large subunit
MEQMNLFLNEPVISSVSEVTAHIRDLMEGDPVLQDVWVKGEVSNLSVPKSGHMYFTIKDEGAALKCIMWRNSVMRSIYQPQNGDMIEVHGSVNVYEAGGQYQLYADKVRPAGEGILFQQFLLLKEKLENEGLFDEDRKQPIPQVPKKIGIVTSPTGAALQDMRDTIQRRYPIVEVILAPSSVQGDAAPNEIVAALERLNKFKGIDVILIARGGGSIEDLWAFNNEDVVRAIAKSEIPVICGVGHETDYTLSDFAADLRAPTPTAAAELATPDLIDVIYTLNIMRGELTHFIEEKIQGNQHHLKSCISALEYLSPRNMIYQDLQTLDEIESRLNRRILHTIELSGAKLIGLENQLAALDPYAVLKRGYAVVTSESGNVVKSVDDVSIDERINIRIQDGGFDAVVKNGEEDE